MSEFFSSLLILGGWFFWTVFGILILFAFLACKRENDWQTGMASFFLVVFGVLFGWKLYLWIGLQALLLGVFGFLVLGTLFSFYRWNKWVKEAKEYYMRTSQSPSDYDYLLARCTPSKHKAELYRWIVFWPFSLFVHLTSDILDTIYDFVSSIYKNIAKSHLKDIQRPVPADGNPRMTRHGIQA